VTVDEVIAKLILIRNNIENGGSLQVHDDFKARPVTKIEYLSDTVPPHVHIFLAD
jgi:hypothetical protein